MTSIHANTLKQLLEHIKSIRVLLTPTPSPRHTPRRSVASSRASTPHRPRSRDRSPQRQRQEQRGQGHRGLDEVGGDPTNVSGRGLTSSQSGGLATSKSGSGADLRVAHGSKMGGDDGSGSGNGGNSSGLTSSGGDLTLDSSKTLALLAGPSKVQQVLVLLEVAKRQVELVLCRTALPGYEAFKQQSNSASAARALELEPFELRHEYC